MSGTNNVEAQLADSVRDLIESYHELNPSEIEELYEEPSPLEFMRYVARNRPFVVRGGARDWPAVQKWNAHYLSEVMGDQEVNVAITPHGNADAVLATKSNHLIFIKPHERTEPFPSVLQHIRAQELHPPAHLTRYLQTQNNCLPDEYAALQSDIPASIPFARIALDSAPDAVNFWLGNSHSVTSLHKDNYENIYVQIVGAKTFVLLPPTEAACVNERPLVGATYVPKRGVEEEGDEAQDLERGLEPKVDEPVALVPTATWDPDSPSEHATPFSRLARPVRVTLEAGDMLYLPALWYHKVSQTCSEEGICCAVNYWYDMEFSGGFWSMCGTVRNAGALAMGRDIRTSAETR